MTSGREECQTQLSVAALSGSLVPAGMECRREAMYHPPELPRRVSEELRRGLPRSPLKAWLAGPPHPGRLPRSHSVGAPPATLPIAIQLSVREPDRTDGA